MPDRADAHIHLFPGSFQGEAFTTRPGVKIDELACYRSLAKDHGVKAALAVGFAAESWCKNNNKYLASLARKHAWLCPLAFVHRDRGIDVADLEALRKRGFFGVSFYVFSAHGRAALAGVDDEVWSWLARRRWLISVNSRGENWSAWLPILKRRPALRLLVSHLGLPPRQRIAPTEEEARRCLAEVLALAEFPAVRVKLSCFYALTDPGHDYPHRAAWPYVQALLARYGAARLLWASDFSPCLDWLTFPQTFGLFNAMPFLSDADRQAIEGDNLLTLLSQVDTTPAPRR